MAHHIRSNFDDNFGIHPLSTNESDWALTTSVEQDTFGAYADASRLHRLPHDRRLARREDRLADQASSRTTDIARIVRACAGGQGFTQLFQKLASHLPDHSQTFIQCFLDATSRVGRDDHVGHNVRAV